MALLLLTLHTACLFGIAPASEDFWWGTATAAPQIEGSPEADGRQPSIWDEGSKPEYHHIRDGSDMRFADMDYVYFENKTLPLLIKSGTRHYRMSISWTRVLRDQTLENPAGVEIPAGIAHYKRVLQLLTSSGIEPVVTMFHWDTPLSLERSYGGFLNMTVMPPLFGEYAKVLLKHFGGFVRRWVSLNEPLTVTTCGYFGGGGKAPFRCSNRDNCKAGDDSTEPYIVAHTQILMHAYAFREFQRYEESIGRRGADMAMALNVGAYCVPMDAQSEADVSAANRCMEWQVGLFFDPIFFGEYPQSVQAGVGSRLPHFSEEERQLVKGSHSGLYFMNYYSSTYAKAAPDACEVCKSGEPGCGWGSCDGGFLLSFEKDGKAIGEKCKANDWLYSHPDGFRGYLRWVSDRYQDGATKLRIVITENGWGDPDTFSSEELLNDVDRCRYYRGHLEAMSLARSEDGVDVRGFFAWSLMDNFEWEDGYSTRFGITYVDYKTQVRVPKRSFWWLQKNAFPLKSLPDDGRFPTCESAFMLRGGTGTPEPRYV